MKSMQNVTRRDFLIGSAALALSSLQSFAADNSTGQLLLAGTQTGGTSEGIYAFRFDAATGAFTLLGLAAKSENPTFLVASPDHKSIFVANEISKFQGVKGGAVSSFAVDAETGALRKVSQVASLGAGTCHVAVDHTGSAVFAANYNGGSAVSFHVTDGNHLGDVVSFFPYTGHGPNKERQEAPHAHRVTVSPDNKHLLVNDLGLDLIHIYKLNAATARLIPNDPPAWEAPAGSGPRALVFHPNGKVAYCVCEMASKVIVLDWDAAAGTLKTAQEFALPVDRRKGTSTGCDIVLDHEARFAYVANRGDNFLATFTVSPDGRKLEFVRRSPCGGDTPRHIVLDATGRWLLVANQVSDTIAAFARDPKTGALADTPKLTTLGRPQCLVFPLKS